MTTHQGNLIWLLPKTTTGIAIARNIGVTKMREKCPQFDIWIAQFEAIVEKLNETQI